MSARVSPWCRYKDAAALARMPRASMLEPSDIATVSRAALWQRPREHDAARPAQLERLTLPTAPSPTTTHFCTPSTSLHQCSGLCVARCGAALRRTMDCICCAFPSLSVFEHTRAPQTTMDKRDRRGGREGP